MNLSTLVVWWIAFSFVFSSFEILFDICYMEGKKEIFYCVKLLSLIEKSLLSSSTQ